MEKRNLVEVESNNLISVKGKDISRYASLNICLFVQSMMHIHTFTFKWLRKPILMIILNLICFQVHFEFPKPLSILSCLQSLKCHIKQKNLLSLALFQINHFIKFSFLGGKLYTGHLFPQLLRFKIISFQISDQCIYNLNFSVCG